MVCTEWSEIFALREEYRAIASLRILVHIEFRAKVHGEGGKYPVSLQFSGEQVRNMIKHFYSFRTLFFKLKKKFFMLEQLESDNLQIGLL